MSKLFLFLFLSISSARALTLENALETTLRDNPEIRQAKAALEEAAGRSIVLHSITYPDLGISGIAGVQGGQRSDNPGTHAFAFAQGNFSQPLFDAAIPASRRRGDLEVLIAQQQLNLVVTEQLQRTRLAFYTTLYQRSQQGLQQTQQQRLAQNAVSQQARYEAGQADRGALAAARVHASEIDPLIEISQRAREVALLDLSNAMGMDLGQAPATVLPKTEGELAFVPIHAELQQATTEALQRRCDLQLARLLVRAASEDQRIVEAGYYPSVKAIVSGDYIPVSGIRRGGSGSSSRSDDFVSSEIRAGGTYTWRLIDNGKVGGAVLRQREAKEINELQLRKMEADIGRQLAQIQTRFQAIAARRASLVQAEKLAQRNLEVVRQNLDQGVASQLEFREAENSLSSARSGLLTAAYEQNVARADWDRATGRYFQFSSDTPANVR